MLTITPAVIERFEAKVDRSGECHLWTGARNSDGYGQFKLGGKQNGAHRVALFIAGVDIPPGMTVDHVWARGCRNRNCVRVDHLEVVTGRVNLLRGSNCSALNARKTKCIRGHELTPDNLVGDWTRGRRCLRCHNELSRRVRAKRRSMTCDNGHDKKLNSVGSAYCPICRAIKTSQTWALVRRPRAQRASGH